MSCSHPSVAVNVFPWKRLGKPCHKRRGPDRFEGETVTVCPPEQRAIMKTLSLFALLLTINISQLVSRANTQQESSNSSPRTSSKRIIVAADAGSVLRPGVTLNHSDNVNLRSSHGIRGVAERTSTRSGVPDSSGISGDRHASRTTSTQTGVGEGAIVIEASPEGGSSSSSSLRPGPATTGGTGAGPGKGEFVTRQVPLCILVDVVEDPYDDRMRSDFKYGKTFIPRVG